MKRFAMRRIGRYGGAAGALVAVAFAVAIAIAAATAAAAPNKPYSVNVHQTLNTPGSFTITLTNDPHASQSLGSANITAPGFVLGAVTSVGGTDAAGFTVTTSGNVVQFRANSSQTALGKGQTVSADVTVTGGIAGCTDAGWKAEAKQSNDFSGTPGNDLTLNPASDLTPLGSFVFAPIETVVQPSGIEVPQIVTGQAAPVSLTALDTCGNVDADYSGATLSPVSGLATATFANPTWADGVGSGSVTPAVVETGDQVQATDPASGISALSTSTGGQDTFDVVQTICAGPGTMCTWKDPGNSGIKAVSTVPANGPSNSSLGLGYRGFADGVTCTSGSSPLPPIPGTDQVQIDPFHYMTAYTVVITYAKSLVGNGPASNFITCKSLDDGATWVPIQACSKSVTTDCVSVAKISGGSIEATLNLEPGDPGSGGFKLG